MAAQRVSFEGRREALVHTLTVQPSEGLTDCEIGNILSGATTFFPEILTPICNIHTSHAKAFTGKKEKRETTRCHAKALSGKIVVSCQRKTLEIPRNMRYPGDFVYIACAHHFRNTLLTISRFKRVVKEYIRTNICLEVYDELHHCILLLFLHLRKVEYAIFYSEELPEDSGHILARTLDELLLIEYQNCHGNCKKPAIDEQRILTSIYHTKDCAIEKSESDEEADAVDGIDTGDIDESCEREEEQEEDFDTIIAQFANPTGIEHPIDDLPSGIDTRIANIMLQRFIHANSLLYSLKPEKGDDKEISELLDICHGFSKEGNTVKWLNSKCYPILIALTRAHIARGYLITESTTIYNHMKELEHYSEQNIDEYILTVYFSNDKLLRKAFMVECDDSKPVSIWLSEMSNFISTSTRVGKFNYSNSLDKLKQFKERLMIPSMFYIQDLDYLKNFMHQFIQKLIALQEILQRLIRKNISETSFMTDFYNDQPHFEARKLMLTILRYIGVSDDTSELYLMAKEYPELYINGEMMSSKCLITLLICEAYKHADTEKRNLQEILKHTIYQCPLYREISVSKPHIEVNVKKIVFLWERVKSHDIFRSLELTFIKEQTQIPYLDFIISYIYFTIIPNDGCIVEDKERDNILSLNASERNAIIYNFIEYICQWKTKEKIYCNALMTFVLFVYECGKQCGIPDETLDDFQRVIRE